MKLVKHIVCLLVLMMAWLPTVGAEANESQSINASEIVLEHIKDTYDWHVTEIGDRSIVINLPVIVKSSTGWHVFSTAEFAHEPDAKGYRMGPAQLAIATRGEHAGKVVELQGEKEVLPFDISITKTVAVMFINVVILLLCILLPARWYRRHKASDAAPGGFTGLVENLGAVKEPNVEKLLAAEPDFVLGSTKTAANVELLDLLERSGIGVAYFDISSLRVRLLWTIAVIISCGTSA